MEKKNGFSLVELIVAITIVITIGISIVSLIPKSFDITADGKKMVFCSREMAKLDTEFSRDFASLIPSLGFYGSGNVCSFWTVSNDSMDAPLLLHTTYRKIGNRYEKVTMSHGGYLSIAETNSFPLVPKPIDQTVLNLLTPSQQKDLNLSKTFFYASFGVLSYGTTNIFEEAAFNSWENSTNCPSRIDTSIESDTHSPLRRFYLRRTLP